jgi:hypothetical protein
MKQAKLQLTADTRGFKKQIDEAKAMIKTLGSGDVSPAAGEKLKQIYSVQLGRALKDVDKQIKNTQKTLETMANASTKSFPADKIGQFTTKLETLRKKYKEIKDLQDEIAEGKMPDVPTADGGGSGGGLLGRGGRVLSLVAGGMGVRAAMSRREQIATGRLQQRALTTDAGVVNETSALGFTTEERRQRAGQIARQSPVSGEQLTNLTNLGEQLERAYGIDQGQFSESVGAARRAGVEDQAGMLSRTVGATSAAGFASPQIIEFMQAQTGYLAEMSKGINIDGASLTGFASAMGTLPFFKSDPSRIFEAMRDMNQAFTSGDEFQKAQAIRAINMSAPGSSASISEFRRGMGLFGELDKTTLANLKTAGVDTRALGLKGPELIQNMFKEIDATTSGMSQNDRLFQFKQRTGLSEGAAASIFGQVEAAKKEGKEVDWNKIQKDIVEASKDPSIAIQEKLNQTFNNADGSTKQLTAMLSRVLDGIATNIAEPMNNLIKKIDDLIKALGGDTEGLASGIGTAGVVGAAALGTAGVLGGGKAISKGAAGIAKGATKAAKGAGSFASKAAKAAPALAKTGGKALGRALPFVGVGMFAKDAYDIYEKWQNGEEITPKDWAILTTSGLAGAAGMVPGVGTAASLAISGASAGAEFLPDDFMQGTPADNIPSSVSPPASGGSSGGGSSFPMFNSSGADNDAALMDNTMALRELLGVLRISGGGFQERVPSNASFVNGRVRG